MQNHNDAMKTSGHRSLEKYTSHFIERVVCERELETEQNCNILTPTLMAITAFLSRSPGLLNRGLGAQPLRDIGSHSNIFSPTHLPLWTSTARSEVLRAPSVGVLVLSTAFYLQLTGTSCHRGYIIIWRPLLFQRA